MRCSLVLDTSNFSTDDVTDGATPEGSTPILDGSLDTGSATDAGSDAADAKVIPDGATVWSEQENDFVFQLASADADAWDRDVDAFGWGWVTGEPFNYENWHEGQPDNGGGVEGVLHFLGYGGMRPEWNDNPVARGLNGYVVEYE